jgi:predicted nuclease with TOPRIM domain
MSKLPKVLNKILSISFLLIYIGSLINIPVYSNEIADLEKQISEKTTQIEGKKGVLATVEAKIKEISSSNYSLNQKIALINEEIAKIQTNIDEKDAEVKGKIDEIAKKQEDLQKKKELIDEVSGQLYMKSRNNSVNFFLSVSNWDSIVENFFAKRSAITLLKEEVEKISGEFAGLEEAKADLSKQEEELDKQKNDLDASYKLLAEEKSKLQKALGEQYSQKRALSAEITDLNAKVSQLQSALITARSAGFVSSGGSTGTVAGTSISQAPAGSFGVFSIGAYTHRNGMSQWGAKARADAGQSYTQILNFYYPGKTLANNTVNISGVGNEALTTTIGVDEYGTLSFEDDYLLGIKEVPESWPMEVLKAQAIAARTFAIRYTNNGRKNICTTQSCQVFSKPVKTGAWRQAVMETRGMILLNSDGTPALTQYAAVHGAWVNGVGWDTVTGNGNDWFNNAWEQKSGVNWFYRSWYINGYGYTGETCGHSPYLTHDEMLIMVNAYLVKNGIGVQGSPDRGRILPSDYGRCPGRLDYGRTDKSPYSLGELKSFLNSPVNAIYSVGIHWGEGVTNTVVFNTDRGYVNISGSGFKDIYNQIAPGHMRIQQQSGYAFFNIEKR